MQLFVCVWVGVCVCVCVHVYVRSRMHFNSYQTFGVGHMYVCKLGVRGGKELNETDLAL